jgi:dihydropteroate synthase
VKRGPGTPPRRDARSGPFESLVSEGQPDRPPRAPLLFNPLIVASDSFPARPEERRNLGIPARRTHGAVRAVRLEGVPARVARHLVEVMSAVGGCAQSAGDGRQPGRVVMLQGDGDHYHLFLDRATRSETTRAVAREVRDVLMRASTRPHALALARGRLSLGQRTLIMGILNVTPDSFSDGGLYAEPERAVARALEMASEGADLIDIGGESTRPGARPVSLREELRRVLPVVEALVPALRSLPGNRPLLSIDTRKSEVARRAAAAGADLINDISGMTHDPAMASVAAECALPVVLQHIRGTPGTMQLRPRYTHLLPEIAAFLRRRIETAVQAGVREDRIVIDPGLGFGKRRRDNLAILRNLRVLTSLGRPILVGASRKSFLKGAAATPPSARLEGSLAAEALAIAGGADIIRVHDVREAARVASLCDAVLRDPVAGR